MTEHLGYVNRSDRRSSRGWRDRIRPRGSMGAPRMFLAWLLFAVLMLAGFVIGLFFLLLGWILLPIVRYGLTRKATKRRAQAGPSVGSHAPQSPDGLQVIEGEYEVEYEAKPNTK